MKRRCVARAELVLARDSVHGLRAVPLSPDPLQNFAAAVADVRPELGESVQVCVDLLPLTPAKTAHLRRRALDTHAGGGLLSELVREAGDLLRELVDEVVSGTSRSSTSVSRQAEHHRGMPLRRGRR